MSKRDSLSKRDSFDLPSEKTNVVLVDVATLRKAEQRIASCEACTPDAAEIPFDQVLDEISGCNPRIVDYVLTKAGKCPRCAGPLKSGRWRWYTSNRQGRKVIIRPGTLVTLKDA